MAEEGRGGKVKEAEGKAKEGHTTQEVAPDVAGFRMKAQNAPETLFVAPVSCRPVACRPEDLKTCSL